MVHCEERGSEIIIGNKSHFNMWEQGGVGQVNSFFFNLYYN